MHISSLQLSSWRNLDDCRLTFAPGCHIITGSNGSGKTNLLEALFVALLGRSQRGAADALLARSNSGYFRLVVSLDRERTDAPCEISVAWQQGMRKKIQQNGETLRQADLFSRAAVVASGPEDIELVAGSPSARRFFIDLYMSQLSSSVLRDLSDYQRILVQKNAALKQGSGASAFEPLQITCGARIMKARSSFIAVLAGKAAARYFGITDREGLAISYEPSIGECGGLETLADWEERFAQELAGAAERERVLKTAVVGPHRDELAVRIGQFAARGFGSQGQWRSAVIALKLGVFDILADSRGESPILLLDELFAELDHHRAEALLRSISTLPQLFLTCAVIPKSVEQLSARRLVVSAGTISDQREQV